jgi:hypothetical protein
MLRTAFLGNRNAFNLVLAAWLARRTDLRVVIWGSADYWARTWRGRLRFFRRRAKRFSLGKALDELLFYVYYYLFMRRREARLMSRMLEDFRAERGLAADVEAARVFNVADVNAAEIREALLAEEVDAMFADCLDAYVKPFIYEAPRHGTFLWHEGFTPEYRGFHSPLYTIIDGELDKVGYSLIKMDAGFDTGPVVLRGRVRGADPLAAPYSIVGHKAILDGCRRVGGGPAAAEGGYRGRGQPPLHPPGHYGPDEIPRGGPPAQKRTATARVGAVAPSGRLPPAFIILIPCQCG